jgi:hypothetical protein
MSNIHEQCGVLKGSIKAKEILSGTIRPRATLSGTISKTVEKVERQSKIIEISENGTLEVVPDANKVLDRVTVVADVIGGNTEEYKGDYEVTPRFEEQTLQTALKVMRNDVVVKEISVTKIANSSGGNTVVIGS